MVCMIVSLVLAALSVPGCTYWSVRGDNSRSDVAQGSEKQRPTRLPASGNSDLLGVSEQARQVERNLGLR
jgi:hypothetical protein